MENNIEKRIIYQKEEDIFINKMIEVCGNLKNAIKFWETKKKYMLKHLTKLSYNSVTEKLKEKNKVK